MLLEKFFFWNWKICFFFHVFLVRVLWSLIVCLFLLLLWIFLGIFFPRMVILVQKSHPKHSWIGNRGDSLYSLLCRMPHLLHHMNSSINQLWRLMCWRHDPVPVLLLRSSKDQVLELFTPGVRLSWRSLYERFPVSFCPDSPLTVSFQCFKKHLLVYLFIFILATKNHRG